MVKLQNSKPALIDLHNVFLYILNDSVRNAKRFVQALKERIKILKAHPELGKPLFSQRFTYVRQVLHKSYGIVYMFHKDTVTILAITHQARLIENIEAIKRYII